MTCRPQLFIETDIRIPLQIGSDAEFTVADIDDLTVTLQDGAGLLHDYAYSTGGVVLDDGQLYLLIDKEDITVAGYYRMSIRLTEQSGKVRGITPCPDILRFYS